MSALDVVTPPERGLLLEIKQLKHKVSKSDPKFGERIIRKAMERGILSYTKLANKVFISELDFQDWIEKRGTQSRSKEGMVYFIGTDEYVKIGVTTNVDQRLSQIHTSCPLPVELLKLEEGGYQREFELHTLFEEYNEKLEWFRNEGDLNLYLKK